MVNVDSARLINLTTHRSATGDLTALGSRKEVPFAIERFFCIAEVPQGEYLGDHAHRTCEQFVFTMVGAVDAEVKDASGGTVSFQLLAGEAGFYVPAGLWLVLRAASQGACIGVLASHPYDPADYIRDWDEFVG